MKRRYLSILWSIPFLIFLVCTLLVIVIQHIVGDTLRTLPEIGLTWFGVVSIEMLILWGSRTLHAFRYGRESVSLRVAKLVVIIFSVIVSCVLICAAVFVSGFAYTPEHIVIRNDIKMVARVSSFLDEQVTYYQYKNAFFCGKELGYEYYGSGGGDPLADTDARVPKRWTLYDLDGKTVSVGGISEETIINNIETEDTLSWPQEPEMKLDVEAVSGPDGTILFSASIDDYIDAYNALYQMDHTSAFLVPASQWERFVYDDTEYSDFKTTFYRFQKDTSNHIEPTISVYVPAGYDNITVLTLDFNEHGYTEWAQELHKQECLYTFRLILPDLDEAALSGLYDELYDFVYTDECYFEIWEKIEPRILFYKDTVGLYPYYSAGIAHICMIPITQDSVAEFMSEGVRLIEIHSHGI